jgi:hypothetical protein
MGCSLHQQRRVPFVAGIQAVPRLKVGAVVKVLWGCNLSAPEMYVTTERYLEAKKVTRCHECVSELDNFEIVLPLIFAHRSVAFRLSEKICVGDHFAPLA